MSIIKYNFSAGFANTVDDTYELIFKASEGLVFDGIILKETAEHFANTKPASLEIINEVVFLELDELDNMSDETGVSCWILPKTTTINEKTVKALCVHIKGQKPGLSLDAIKNSSAFQEVLCKADSEAEVKKYINHNIDTFIVDGVVSDNTGIEETTVDGFSYAAFTVVGDPNGLHARPAAALTKVAHEFSCDLTLVVNSTQFDAASVGALMGSGVSGGTKVILAAKGDSAEEAVKKAVEIVAKTPESVKKAKKSNIALPTFKPSVNALEGVPASPGVGIAPAYIIEKEQDLTFSPDKSKLPPAEEAQRIVDALAKVTKALEETVAHQKAEGNSAAVDVFSAHITLVNDTELVDQLKSATSQGDTAENIVLTVFKNKADTMAKMDNQYMAERAADYHDLRTKVFKTLIGEEATASGWPDGNFIIVTDDLTPTQTASLPKGRVSGIITSDGGPTAHSAILARALGIPAIVGVGKHLSVIKNNDEVVVNGISGFAEYQLTPEIRKEVTSVQEKIQKIAEKQDQAKFEEAVTIDGHKIEIGANAATLDDVVQSVNNGAESIGLLRTELVFQNHQELPTEDEQVRVFTEIAGPLKGKPAIVRMFDIGADKPVPFLDQAEEENPFLGVRGVRLVAEYPELIRTQAASILRTVKETGMQAKIMIPMVSRIEEIETLKDIIEEERVRLDAPKVPVGIMVEVPAAAVMIDIIAPFVDFFSIGTNDLTQYTMAVDRQHPVLAKTADALDPAVLRMIDITVKGAHRYKKWVGVCGNMAADPLNAKVLTALGVDELSMGAASIPAIKAAIRTFSFKELRVLGQKAIKCRNPEEVRKLFQ